MINMIKCANNSESFISFVECRRVVYSTVKESVVHEIVVKESIVKVSTAQHSTLKESGV